MEKRRIGDLEVSVVGIGCNNFGRVVDEAGTRAVVEAALEEGINFFDTSDSYCETKSEVFLGRALGVRRRDAIVATKFATPLGTDRPGGASPAYIRLAVEDSLRRLGTDYIDLYQLHRPDPKTPIADTLGALDELVKAGKVRRIGASNFSVAQIEEAEAAVKPGAARFCCIQNQYSLFHREPENGVLAECARRGLAFLPYFPLASGLLSGKYRRGAPFPAGRLTTNDRYANLLTDANLAEAEALADFAESRGRTILELAFSWLLSRPVVASVIAGATKPEQVRANAAAPGWKLTAADRATIDRITASASAEG